MDAKTTMSLICVLGVPRSFLRNPPNVFDIRYLLSIASLRVAFTLYIVASNSAPI